MTYVTKSKKDKPILTMINQALDILNTVGIPFTDLSERKLERMAMVFMAVADVTTDWSTAKGDEVRRSLGTRDIIEYINNHFGENISSGSYDDIRRQDLRLLVLANLVVNSSSKPGAATNDPTRGYTLNPDFKKLILTYGTADWAKNVLHFVSNKPSLAEILSRRRDMEKIPVTLPGGKPIELSLGEHNVLQKAVIEQFLPRFGSDCEVLYIGDTSNKILHIEKEELKNLKFFDLSHDELPDIIAYSKKKNWLYLIEAVHSSGPMSEIRVHELKLLLKDCKAELIFVTAFLSKDVFRKWVSKIAWETEVWIADNADHLIHFNGHKFLGAY
jgi:hypothetical protein